MPRLSFDACCSVSNARLPLRFHNARAWWRSSAPAIEAGAAFRSLAERHGAIEITEIRRQREAWQQDATRDLANGHTGDALAAYRDHGMGAESHNRGRARVALIEGWRSERGHDPALSRVILSHTRDEVRTLDDMALDALEQGGQLGDDIAVQTASGERLIAERERIIFLANDRELGVKNGTSIRRWAWRSLSVPAILASASSRRPRALPNRP